MPGREREVDLEVHVLTARGSELLVRLAGARVRIEPPAPSPPPRAGLEQHPPGELEHDTPFA